MSLPTLYDVACAMNPALKERESLTGADFDAVGLPMFGGCAVCEASIAAFNACPGKNGYLIGTCCATDENCATTIEEAVAICTPKEADLEDGIEAIIFLQAEAGIVETREQAQAGWLAMSASEKAKTIETHEWFKEGGGA